MASTLTTQALSGSAIFRDLKEVRSSCARPAMAAEPMSVRMFARASAAKRRGVSAQAAAQTGSAASDTAVEVWDLPGSDWPENFSILQYEDLCAHYESIIFKDSTQPSAKLENVMSRTLTLTTKDTNLAELNFGSISGMPVVDDKKRVIGVITKKDVLKVSEGTVGDVMSSPAMTVASHKTVSDAAALMLKYKINRIPVVNNKSVVVGIVTRTDIFTAMEA